QKDHAKRGGQDYRKKAVLNLKEYSRILVRCALYYNNEHYLSDYPLTQHMIEAKIPPIPIKLFEWGLKSGNGLLRSMSYSQIRSNVLPISQAIVDYKGIYFKGLYYSCRTAIKERWFSNARINGSWKIEVRYDPQDMSEIYIRKNRKDYETCTLIEQYDMYKSARMEELIDLTISKRQQEVDFQESEINGQIRLAQEIEEIVNEAKKEAKMDLGEGIKNIKDIRQNRKEEQELTRQKRSVDIQVLNTDVPSSSTVNSASKKIRNIDLFRQKQKEGLNNENH
ncbi:Mu transposase C-terminal domain-containing protein, partial [Nocardia sp. NPDC019309]